MRSTQNYNVYYTKLQANYVLYYKRIQLYYDTLHYATFPFFDSYRNILPATTSMFIPLRSVAAYIMS